MQNLFHELLIKGNSLIIWNFWISLQFWRRRISYINRTTDQPVSYLVTAWRVSIFGVILVRIFPHSDWIRRDTLWQTYSKARKWLYKIIFLTPYLCNYRKGFSTQLALLSLTEKCRKFLDNRGSGGAILMDLSKTFYPINHHLLRTKFHAYGFDKGSLKLVCSCLNRGHRKKINQSFILWEKLFQRARRGTFVGPLLFNIYLNDLIYLAESVDLK